MLHRDLRCGHGELNEPPHLLYFALFDMLKRVEIFHFRGNRCGKTRGIELGDRPHPAAAREDVLPCLFSTDAKSTDQSQACYHNSARQILSSSSTAQTCRIGPNPRPRSPRKISAATFLINS